MSQEEYDTPLPLGIGCIPDHDSLIDQIPTPTTPNPIEFFFLNFFHFVEHWLWNTTQLNRDFLPNFPRWNGGS